MTWHPGDLLTIETDRFVLRSMTREDIDQSFLDWIGDPEVAVGLNMPRQRLSRVQAVGYLRSFDNAKAFILKIREKASGAPIGFFTIHINAAHQTAETAVVIGDRAHWGTGVVLEGRGALLTFLFETMGVHKVMGRPHGRNIASIFNYKAMGFTCEAVLREQMRPVAGEDRLDQLVFGLLRSEWEILRNER